ncbi:MAG: hypothetical protein ACM3VT_13210, partial [Solirubrobacterales bacterium]
MSLMGIMLGRLRLPVVAFCAAALMAAVAIVFVERGQSDLYRVTVLPSYGGMPFLPRALNDRGQIVGLMMRAGGGFSVSLWDRKQGLRDLGIATDDLDRPMINNLGQVAGVLTDANRNETVFLWDLA